MPIKESGSNSLNEEQKIAVGYIYDNPITIITGRPGSGKSFCAAHCALDFIYKKMTGSVMLLRPTVEVGKSLGYLKGGLEQKIEPYFEAFLENIMECGSENKDKVRGLIEAGIFKESAIQFVRGKTFNEFVVIDEAQNTSRKEMEAIITRLGKNGKMVILGDLQQKDITDSNDGLSWLIDLSNHFDEIKRIDLKGNHRHDLVQRILDYAYKKR